MPVGAQPRAVPDPNGVLNCTKMLKADQVLCVTRNEALIRCKDPKKYPDYDRCTLDMIAQTADPGLANCKDLSKERLAFCQKRNKVYQACKRNRLNYFACLESETAGQ